jgi:hypothetical protein
VVWFFAALAVLCTFVIAAVSVGGVTAQLAARSRRSVYDLAEAEEIVADLLPPEVSGEITFEDLRAALGWYVEFLQLRGIASTRGGDDPGSGLIVVDEEQALAFVLGRVEAAKVDQPGAGLTDDQVFAILAANRSYERSIGLIGDPVDVTEPKSH